jgi:putative ABC transport system permease protein
MDRFRQDLRYAFRSLTRSGGRGAAATALLLLALGIGATTAIFSVVQGVLIRDLPLHHADRLVNVFPRQMSTGGRSGGGTASKFAYDLVAGQREVFEQTAGFMGARPILTGAGEPSRIWAWAVTPNFFSMIGAQPLAGRVLLPEDDVVGAPRVAVVSYGFWSSRLGSNRDLENSFVTLDSARYQVVGVMPPDFNFPRLPIGFGRQSIDIWRPLGPELTQSQRAVRRPFGGFWMLGLLRPHVTVEQARAVLNAAMQPLWSTEPGWKDVVADLTPAKELLVRDVRKPLWLVLGAVATLLVIACANVASLLLARALARQREIAIRIAIGASRIRIARQLLTEALVLSLVGGALGTLLAAWAVPALLALGGHQIPRADEIGLDGTVLLTTLGTSLCTGLLFGLVPVVQIDRKTSAIALKAGGGGIGATRGKNRTGDTLVVIQMALTLVLLAGAGLLAFNFYKLLRSDTGFEAEHVISAQLVLPSDRYRSAALRLDFSRSALGRARALPGVTAATVSTGIPLASGAISSVEVSGQTPRPDRPLAFITAATPDYFRVFGIPVVRGDVFRADDGGDPHGVVISEAAAREYFPGDDPIGKRIATYGDSNWTIIGVVRDLQQDKLDAAPPPVVYLSLRAVASSSLKVSVRTTTDAASLASSLRAAIHEIDPTLPLDKLETMQSLVADSLLRQRFYSTLLTIFAAMALVIAAAGLFALASYTVTARMRELGIRVALGAQRREILRLVVGRGLMLATIGCGLGCLGALATTGVLRSLLYDVSASDPRVFATVAVLLLATALLATFLPARRAARVDPMLAFRNE